MSFSFFEVCHMLISEGCRRRINPRPSYMDVLIRNSWNIYPNSQLNFRNSTIKEYHKSCDAFWTFMFLEYNRQFLLDKRKSNIWQRIDYVFLMVGPLSFSRRLNLLLNEILTFLVVYILIVLSYLWERLKIILGNRISLIIYFKYISQWCYFNS